MVFAVYEGPKMGAGDPGMEDIYHWDAEGPRIAFKGPVGTSRRDLPTGHNLRVQTSNLLT